MNILALGDIVGTDALEYLSENLWKFRREHKIDFTVANGENVSQIRGIGASEAKDLLACGVDVITLGNHAFGKRDLYPFLENESRIIRPANFPSSAPGMGYTVADLCGYRLLCMNVNGCAFMDSYANPFDTVDKILEREKGKYDFSLLDIHAEATSEKLALGRYFDGRVNILFGTHTHVTTADEQILPKGSAYQTDLGMTGPADSILGVEADVVIEKFRTLMPTRFEVAKGKILAHGTVFSMDANGKISGVKRVVF